MRFATRTIHAGQAADSATGATVIPIYQTATFTQEGLGIHKGYEYARSSNPTRTALETCIASLEGGRFGLAFGSGMAAEAAVLGILESGDHVVAAEDLYGGTYRLFEQIGRKNGLDFTYVDAANPDNIGEAIKPNTKLIWIETPTNPLLNLVDIGAVAEAARNITSEDRGPRTEHRICRIPVAVDNTFASPALQNPIELGAAIVVHSTTKYLGGHSDVIGGAVVVNDEQLYRRIKLIQNAAGGVPGPFDCWLTLRGIKTLELRMEQHCANAERIAEFLTQHPRVEKVFYPGSPDHPDHELAAKQMRGFGGMVSFQIAGGLDGAKQALARFRLFSLAESLGGVESLVGHPVSMSHAGMPEEERLRRGITPGLIRLSVGIEDADDLLQDLAEALA